MSTIKVSKIYASSETKFRITMPSGSKLNIQGGYAINSEHQFKVPVGTTAERPSNAVTGSMRYNTTTETVEGFNGTGWVSLMQADSSTAVASIPQKSLIVHLDANNPNSLLQQGEPDDNYWYNLVNKDYKFGIPTDRMAVENIAGNSVRYMDFSVNGGGCAKYDKMNGDMPWYPHCSVVMFLKWRTDNSQWRTPLRSWHANHHIIVYDGARDLGMYDNDANGFQDTGYNIDQFPEWNTKFNMYTWRFSSSTGSYAPCYQCFFKDEANARATINNGSSTFDRGFYHIGAWGDGNNNPHSSSQNAGGLAVFLFYGRHISQAERSQIYNYYKDTFDI